MLRDKDQSPMVANKQFENKHFAHLDSHQKDTGRINMWTNFEQYFLFLNIFKHICEHIMG